MRQLRSRTEEGAEKELRENEFLVYKAPLFFGCTDEHGLNPAGKRAHRRNVQCQRQRRKSKRRYYRS